jgi:myo-inositol-1-phosphate synthase
VAAFDVDRRKVGLPLTEAIHAEPDCAEVFAPKLPESGTLVSMGPVLDGVAGHMADYPESEAVRVAARSPVDVAETLRAREAKCLSAICRSGRSAGFVTMQRPASKPMSQW